MNKGYQEFIVFMRSWLSHRITITHEKQDENPPFEHYYFFTVHPKNYVLMISDGFALYECLSDGTHMPVFTPLENDFKGLDGVLKDIKLWEKGPGYCPKDSLWRGGD